MDEMRIVPLFPFSKMIQFLEIIIPGVMEFQGMYYRGKANHWRVLA
jgi:hypothetical protein